MILDEFLNDIQIFLDAVAIRRQPPIYASSSEAREQAAMSRLDVFVAPKPNFALIGAMTLVNRVLMLKGVAGLRDLAPFDKLAGLRGVANVRSIDFPEADRARLAAVCHASNATFLTPNHPEFFTDWMIDKEVAARVCPKAAFWATNSVVNGLGRLAQRFWLANNLIAQIPGNSAPAREHSIAWALQGHGVLLHPEGGVGWHGDYVAPLLAGAVEMAREALTRGRRTNAGQGAFVAPVVWKMVFDRDVESELMKECAYVERSLDMDNGDGLDLPGRVYRLYETLLSWDERAVGIAPSRGTGFADRKRNLVAALCARLAALLGTDGAGPDELLRIARKRLRETAAGSGDASAVKPAADMLTLNLRLGEFAFSGESISQEGLAEHIKRIRNDYCRGSWRDTLNRFVPQPAGPRTAHIRVPVPLAMHDFRGSDEDALHVLRSSMQAALDSINADLRRKGRSKRCPNPFHG